MEITVSLGWWLVPLAVTIIAFGAYITWEVRTVPSYGYGRIGDGIASAILMAAALIVSLIAWLIWAVLT